MQDVHPKIIVQCVFALQIIMVIPTTNVWLSIKKFVELIPTVLHDIYATMDNVSSVVEEIRIVCLLKPASTEDAKILAVCSWLVVVMLTVSQEITLLTVPVQLYTKVIQKLNVTKNRRKLNVPYIVIVH